MTSSRAAGWLVSFCGANKVLTCVYGGLAILVLSLVSFIGCDPKGEDPKGAAATNVVKVASAATTNAAPVKVLTPEEKAAAEAKAKAEAEEKAKKEAEAKAAAEKKAAEEKAKKEEEEKAKKEALERDKALAEAKAKGEAAAKFEAEAKAKAVEDAKKAAEAAAKILAEEKAKAEKKAEEDAKKRAEEEKVLKAEREKKEAADKTERQEHNRAISSRVFKLYHVNAQEVADKFNSTWSGEFGEKYKVTKMAQAFEESNTVMVSAPNKILDDCARIVSEIDREAEQVYIEARFVELGNSASRKVGIDWTMMNGIELKANGSAGVQKTIVGNAVDSYTRTITTKEDGTTTYKVSGTSADDQKSLLSSESDDGKIAFFSGTLSVSEMALTLKALDSSGDTKTFSNPKIIVSSGKKATVDMTTKYPNVKVSAKRTEASASTSLDIASNLEAIPGTDTMMFAKEAFFSWGITLQVTPRIGTNGLINVAIVPTISSLDSWVETGTSDDSSGTIASKYPVIKVQRLVSEFNLESGTTAVIGGLSITEETQNDSGIPWLRKIPLIGPRLFGSKERSKVQKEIIVFVTVGLVNPRAVNPAEGLPKNAILGRQYVKSQKLEPGDKPEKNMEGFDSLDLRALEDQAKDPLRRQKSFFDLDTYIPFKKEDGYKGNAATGKAATNQQGN